MDKITRYLILLFICIIFFALAPLIVIYVSGKSFSFEQSTNDTGILDVQSKPSSAQVFLNGKLTDTTPTTIRFVKQGTYDIEIKKDGYYSWTKKLFIEGGKVTYAGNINDAIKLLPHSKANQLTEQDIKTILEINNQVLFITADNTASIYDLNKKSVVNSTKLSSNIIELSKTQNNNLILAKSDDKKSYFLNLSTLKLTPLPNSINTAQNIDVVSDNLVVAQVKNSLLAYDTNSKIAPKVILEDILAFTTNQNLIYIASKDSIQTYFWDGKNLSKQSTLYNGVIAKGNSLKLYLTNHKELFLQVDRSLYRINNQPELVSNQVNSINFNPTRQELTFNTPTEIYFYNFKSSQTELFYRSTETIKQAVVVPELGYGFISTEKDIEAIEIDNRNGQNQYSLFSTSPTNLMQLSENENQLVILADRKLYSIIVN